MTEIHDLNDEVCQIIEAFRARLGKKRQRISWTEEDGWHTDVV